MTLILYTISVIVKCKISQQSDRSGQNGKKIIFLSRGFKILKKAITNTIEQAEAIDSMKTRKGDLFELMPKKN